MSTKKILLVVGGIVAVLGLLVGLFVGGVVWIAFSAIGKSEAAQTAKTFLRQNEKLKGDIGEVRDFGFWVTGNINSNDSDGEATLNLKVIGANKTVPASVNLTYRSGRSWVVTGASYKSDGGQSVDLMDAYQSDALGASDRWDDSAPAGSPGSIAGFDENGFRNDVLEAEGPAAIVFLSRYSLDSRELEKALDDLAETYSERVTLVRYDVDEKPTALRRFKLEKVPALILFLDGAERERLTGKITKSDLSRVFDKYLETE